MQEALDTLEAQAVGSGEGGGGGAVAVGGDQVSDVALIEAVTQALRTFCARSRGAHGAGAGCGVAKLQVSGWHGVRVSGEYLHRARARVSDLGIHVSPVCESRLWSLWKSCGPHPARAALAAECALCRCERDVVLSRDSPLMAPCRRTLGGVLEARRVSL